jgi:hypothetical protein
MWRDEEKRISCIRRDIESARRKREFEEFASSGKLVLILEHLLTFCQIRLHWGPRHSIQSLQVHSTFAIVK